MVQRLQSASVTSLRAAVLAASPAPSIVVNCAGITKVIDDEDRSIIVFHLGLDAAEDERTAVR